MSDFRQRVKEIRQKIRDRSQQGGVDWLFIDLLNLIEDHQHEVWVSLNDSDVQSGDAGWGKTEVPS